MLSELKFYQNILTAENLVRTLLDAHLSSQEETIFGDFLEGLAIFINAIVYGGRKSAAEGIDLEFDKEGINLHLNLGKNFVLMEELIGRNWFRLIQQ